MFVPCHSLWPSEFLLRNQLITVRGFLWMLNVAFHIFFFVLHFCQFDNLSLFLLGIILPGTICTSWTSVNISFPMLGEFSTIIYSNIFSDFFPSSPSGTHIIWMLVHLMSHWWLRFFWLIFLLCLLFCFILSELKDKNGGSHYCGKEEKICFSYSIIIILLV